MSSKISVEAVRAYISVEADSPITFHTGKVTKTLLFSLLKEVRLYRAMKGIVSPIHVSPLFRPGRKDWELGVAVTPEYIRVNSDEKLVPVSLDGEYIIHVGGYRELVEKAKRCLSRVRTPLQVKIEDSIVIFKLESMKDVSKDIFSKHLTKDKVTLYIKAPTKLFNVFVPSKLPKFSVSAIETLIVPYMFLTGNLTITERLLLNALPILGRLIEAWYSINTVKTTLIPFNGRKTPVMTGKITYIVQDRDKYCKTFADILNIAEIVGIGQSRQNGFGTTTWR